MFPIKHIYIYVYVYAQKIFGIHLFVDVTIFCSAVSRGTPCSMFHTLYIVVLRSRYILIRAERLEPTGGIACRSKCRLIIIQIRLFYVTTISDYSLYDVLFSLLTTYIEAS